MEKKIVVENESVDIAGVLSMLLFGVSIAMWVLALVEISNNPLVCTLHLNGGMFQQCWDTVCTLWTVSLWYKLWIITAVASTATCWCYGGFFAIATYIASFFLPIVTVESVFLSGILTGISLSTWIFIIGCNIGVLLLWCIVMGVKEYLKEKKEVSLKM